MKKEKSCGGIVLNEKNEVLLIRHNKGHWGFPKGHVEAGETEEQTAIREIKEETNIDVIINKDYRYTLEYRTDSGNMKEVVYFLAKNISNCGKPQLEEVSEIEWLEFEKALEKITYDNSRGILKKVIEDLKTK